MVFARLFGGKKPKQASFANKALKDQIRACGERQGTGALEATGRVDEAIARSGLDELEPGVIEKLFDSVLEGALYALLPSRLDEGDLAHRPSFRTRIRLTSAIKSPYFHFVSCAVCWVKINIIYHLYYAKLSVTRSSMKSFKSVNQVVGDCSAFFFGLLQKLKIKRPVLSNGPLKKFKV